MSGINQQPANKKRVKIVIAEDHVSVRKGIIQLLGEAGNFKIVGEASNGRELLDILPELSPDVLLLDIDMPQMNGKEALQKITKLYPSIRPIILSGHFGNMYVREFVNIGARAYLPKSCDVDELVETINRVYEHGFAISKGFGRAILSAHLQQLKPADLDQMALTDKEGQVLKLICEGLSSKQMAAALNVEINTITFHKKNIYRKTNLRSTASLVKYAIKNGFTDL